MLYCLFREILIFYHGNSHRQGILPTILVQLVVMQLNWGIIYAILDCYLTLKFIKINISLVSDCHSYFESRSLLQDPVDLNSKGSKKTSIVSEDSKVCKLHGQYFEYNGFQARWKNITDGESIFSLKTKGGNIKEIVVEVSVCQTFQLLLEMYDGDLLSNYSVASNLICNRNAWIYFSLFVQVDIIWL